MISKILHFIAGILVLTGCEKGKQVVIVGKVQHPTENKIYYSAPINAITFGGFGRTLDLSQTNTFRIVLDHASSGFVEVNYDEIKGWVFVQPGHQYSININTQNSDSSFLVYGKNSLGSLFYRRLQRPKMIQQEARKYRSDSLASQVKEKLEKEKKEEMEQLTILFRGKAIDHQCFRFLKADIEYYYALLLSEVCASRFLHSIYAPNQFVVSSVFPKSFEKVWMQVLKDYPVQTQRALRTRWWYDYAFNCCINFQTYYKGFEENTFDTEWFIKEIIEKRRLYDYTIEQVEKSLSGPFLEYFQARLLYKNMLQNPQGENWDIDLSAFQSVFPNSPFLPFLEKQISHKKEDDAYLFLPSE